MSGQTHKDKIFERDMGQKAKVERELVGGTGPARANASLLQLGAAVNPKPETLEYLGSGAVHIYKSPILDQLFFISQTETLGTTPEIVADKALTDLRASFMERYGRTPGRKRSGF